MMENGRAEDSPEVARLFEDNIEFADRLARRYSHGGTTDEDMQQVARLALLLACRQFDPDLGRFLRFASMTIVGELKKHLRSHGWAVHVPRRLQENSITVARATDQLTQQIGRRPLISEIASATGLSVEHTTEAVRVHSARFRAPLDGADETIEDAHDPATIAMVNTALDTLDSTDRELIAMRFEDGLTQREIGEQLGVSQPEAYRRITRALSSLREHLGTPNDHRTSS